jgi:signal transduction histidine kinase
VNYGGHADVRVTMTSLDITITVEDDGPGIPAAEIERVFTPFYRLERSRSRDTGGVGLGLAVARAVIREHGGDITLRNRPESGLRQTVVLPRSELLRHLPRD